MKKLLSLVLCLTAFLLVGCTSNVETNDYEGGDFADTETLEELKTPELTNWTVYNPNGFNTITGVFHNPNKVVVDMYYDLVYYNNGTEIGRSEGFMNYANSPDHDAILWGNHDIPDPSKVTDIKIENAEVTKTNYEILHADIKYVRTEDGCLVFDVKNEKKPTQNTISVLFYNDKNGNKKCDNGEAVGVSFGYSYEEHEEVAVDYWENYTDYEVFYESSITM